MDFFDKLGQKANEAYKFTADKTGKLAREAKLRLKIGDLRSEINNIYKDIGKAIYENHVREEKEDLSKKLEEDCIKIDCLSDEIEKNLDECLYLKGIRKCSNCYTEISIEDKFCSKCGQKQEPMEEPIKEVEICENEVDVEDNSEENKEKDNNGEDNNDKA